LAAGAGASGKVTPSSDSRDSMLISFYLSLMMSRTLAGIADQGKGD